MSNKAARFNGGGLERLGADPDSAMVQTKEFDRLQQFSLLQAAPRSSSPILLKKSIPRSS